MTLLSFNLTTFEYEYVEIKCQLDATEVFIAFLIACSICFGHHYAHHQELKSNIQWLLPVVFRAVFYKLLVWCGAEGYVFQFQNKYCHRQWFFEQRFADSHGLWDMRQSFPLFSETQFTLKTFTAYITAEKHKNRCNISHLDCKMFRNSEHVFLQRNLFFVFSMIND